MKKILVSIVGVLFVVFIIAVIWRAFVLVGQEKTAQIVEGIQNTRLTMDDVLGTNLPPDPGENADKTIAGVDANANGIRDDVELAIFRDYPNDPKTRAVLLQYALALQMEMTQLITNGDVVTAVASQTSQAVDCIGTLYPATSLETPRSNEEIFNIEKLIKVVSALQLNTEERQERQEKFYKNISSYQLPSGCHIDLSILTD
jgi:hypothetical protein